MKMVQNKMTCSACGSSSAPEGSRFCPDCGTNLSLESEDVNTMDTPLATAVPVPMSTIEPLSPVTTATVEPPLNDVVPSTIAASGVSPTIAPRAMYFKNPTPEMLARTSKHGFNGGVLFVEACDRRGKFTVPQSISVVSVMNGTSIDLSVADFVYPKTTIRVVPAVMSGLKIKVPRGVRVEMQGIGIMGGMKGLKTQNIHAGEDGPLLVVQGLTVMGCVKVTVNEYVPAVKVV